jgi:hypothetical protein
MVIEKLTGMRIAGIAAFFLREQNKRAAGNADGPFRTDT